VAGGESSPVTMTFKHRTRTALMEFLTDLQKIATAADPESAPDADLSLDRDVDSFMQMVSAWELEDEFNRDNVRVLLDNYPGTAVVTYQVYRDELLKAKLGN